MEGKLTHKQLVDVAYRWVLNNTSCGVAFKELNSLSSTETPDVIGFGSWGHSVLVEVKVTRSDFLSDKKKTFRRYPEQGMGSQRFYCCPTGLIKKEELPEGWGLVYVNNKLRPTCVYHPYKGNIGERHDVLPKNIRAEHGLMYSALRRLHLRGRIDEIYENPNNMATHTHPSIPCPICGFGAADPAKWLEEQAVKNALASRRFDSAESFGNWLSVTLGCINCTHLETGDKPIEERRCTNEIALAPSKDYEHGVESDKAWLRVDGINREFHGNRSLPLPRKDVNLYFVCDHFDEKQPAFFEQK